ncbi:hypothetical protein EST38_g6997 [Candolleomyces aberdarensis]|uniref:Uncharacterized protein n=1 Tax=Candolleomyces aberdarensis TaxID=2316362 RepID=A0A4V1Q3K0_9AGAR|nr:hypothetical protein EST38_g6997 [Candolleomyces aberdarensis]
MKAPSILRLFLAFLLSLWLRDALAAPIVVCDSHKLVPTSELESRALGLTVSALGTWLRSNAPRFKNKMLFNSGYTQVGSSKQPVLKTVASFEQKNGLMSLSSLLKDKGPPPPKGWTRWNHWARASEAMASVAQGRVTVLLGEQVDPNSIWHKFEFPALKANRQVTEVQRYVLNKDGKLEGPTKIWPDK